MYRPGKDNHVADTLSRNYCATVFGTEKLNELHISLCHPGVARLTHFVRTKNLPFSVDDVKRVTSNCSVCAELKPQFFHSFSGCLIEATQPFERLSIDFKGPLPSHSRNKYLLTIIDEYSRFPFAFPCSDVASSTVISCLCQLFSIFGMPAYIHSDRGASFMSTELRQFLLEKGVAASHTTAYNPQGNGQIERLNRTLWKTVCLALKSRNLPPTHWEVVLTDALHSIRSLLCTATNCTPHERMFQYSRRSTNGLSLPTWLTVPGPVFLKRVERSSKYDPLVEEVQLVNCNPQYAHIVHADGKTETVSVRRLAPVAHVEPSTDQNRLPLSSPPQVETSEQPDNRSDQDEAEVLLPLPNPQTTGYDELLERQQRTRPYNLRSREV